MGRKSIIARLTKIVPITHFEVYRTKRVGFVATFRLAGAEKAALKLIVSSWGMNTPKCPACGRVMTRYGHSASGAQRWRCTPCHSTGVQRIDTSAKHLGEFLAWLLSGNRQADMPGGGRSFRRRCQSLWEIWPLAPVVDEVHEVIFVDGIHLGRKAVVLIAQSRGFILGWYVARSENSRAWEALMSPIAPPALVLTDGGSGFARVCTKVWPATRVQRCTFHAYCRIRQATRGCQSVCVRGLIYKYAVNLSG